jgi:hypothetical protein
MYGGGATGVSPVCLRLSSIEAGRGRPALHQRF